MKTQILSLKGWHKMLLGFFLAWTVGSMVDFQLRDSGPWAIVGGLPSTISAPVALPIMSYPEAFRAQAAREHFVNSPNEDLFEVQYGEVGDAGSRKGFLFGALQVLAFYFPFFPQA